MFMPFKSIADAKNLLGKNVLVRADFNVPIKNKKVADNFKIERGLATIIFLLKKGARVFVVSHLGRPIGKDKKFTLKPVADELERLLHRRVNFLSLADLFKHKKIEDKINLLENIRFYKEEDDNDKQFAKKLAGRFDLFVLDGFAVAHRHAASVTGVAKFLPTYVGLLLEEELKHLHNAAVRPKKPLVVILGGAKIETKIPILKNLLPKASHILIGGGLANTYLYAKGYKVGASLVEKNYIKEMLRYGDNSKVVVPVDLVVGGKNGRDAKLISVNSHLRLDKNIGIYDIGPKTVHLFSQYIRRANTLIWNGALGYFEQPPYQHGTFAIARFFAARAKGRAFGVCGGGETVEIMRRLHLLFEADLVSTGGGAMLLYLAGKKLPGVEMLKK